MDFINQSTEDIAKQLLGKKILINHNGTFIGGYIVETEAYVGIEDMACHTYNNKRTPKVESMYLEGGAIYVYTMHTHKMLNIVTKQKDDPQAVLIRAIEPSDNIDIMIQNRKIDGINITNGPGKLTAALMVTKEMNGSYINDNFVFIDYENSLEPKEIIASPRIGIPDKGIWTDEPLRFYVKGNPFVSLIPKKDIWKTKSTWK